MPHKLWGQLREFYAPFVDRLYHLLNEKQIAISPCQEMGSRFLDPPDNSSGLFLRRRGKRQGIAE